MKKVLFLLAAVLGMALLFTSCDKDVTPEFKFQLEVNGAVSDSATNITSDFVANVSNETVNFVNNGEEILTLDAPEAIKTNAWLENYVKETIGKNYSNKALYTIHVKGYVKETLTGLVFSIDKTFTNMPIEIIEVPVIEEEDTTATELNEDTTVLDTVE